VNLQRKEYNGLLYNLKLKYHPEVITATEEHPFYVRTQRKIWNNSLRKYDYSFAEPEWKIASRLTTNDYFGMVINSKEEIPTFHFDKKINQSRTDVISITLNDPKQWFTMGYFVGDGLNTEYRDVTLSDILKQFGKYAHGKLIPEWVQDAPKEFIQEFINGYIAADGCSNKNNSTRITTVSHNLAYGIQRLFLKMGHIASIVKTIRPKTCVIEGRVVNQLDTYQLSVVLNKQSNVSTFIENNYVWYAPFKITSEITQHEPVYNFEVETDNSYIVYNTIAHNCQSFSNAGKKKADDPRNTMFLEFLRVATITEPHIIIGENVKGLLTKQTATGENYIDIIVAEFEKIGYDVIHQVFKTEQFGVPQKRERLIILGVKKDNPYGWTPKFPTPSTQIPNLIPIVNYDMTGAVKVEDDSWFSEIPDECILTNMADTKVYPDNNGGHPYLLSKLFASEEDMCYSGKQHENLFSFGKRDSPIHCEIIDIRNPSKTIICTYEHQPRLFVPLKNASGYYLRMLLPLELKQIQGFPANHIVCGNIKEQIIQIGNAVPPPLIKAIVEKVTEEYI
jgi:DNA-methyltransferase (dcm)